MRQTTTKMKRVNVETCICDICGKTYVDQHMFMCDVCKRDICYEHSCSYAGDILPVKHAGNYRCCPECNKKLEPCRTKLRELKTKYESERSKIIIAFMKEFGLDEE